MYLAEEEIRYVFDEIYGIILISTQNIGSNGEMTKIIFQISSNTHLISSSDPKGSFLRYVHVATVFSLIKVAILEQLTENFAYFCHKNIRCTCMYTLIITYNSRFYGESTKTNPSIITKYLNDPKFRTDRSGQTVQTQIRLLL